MNVTMLQYTLWTWRWIWLIFLLLKFWHPRRIFDVPMNKTLQELSSSITKAVQYYMTQRTPDNTLHPHTHAHTYTHTCILYIPSLTRCLQYVYWLLQWHGSAMFHLSDANKTLTVHTHTHIRTLEQLRTMQRAVCLASAGMIWPICSWCFVDLLGQWDRVEYRLHSEDQV